MNDIRNFELPNEEKPKALRADSLSKESLVTKHMVNLRTVEFFNHGVPNDYLKILLDILLSKEFPFTEILNKTRLSDIKKAYRQLITQ